MSSEDEEEQNDESVGAVDAAQVKSSDDSESSEDEQSDADFTVELDDEPDESEDDTTSPDDKVYIYTIPVERIDGALKAVYTPTRGGTEYFSYYSPNKHVFITDKPSPQLHKKEVNVTVQETTREVVESSDSLVRDFT
jgi:hypothetical protein